jgi:hypothetical protein
MNEPNAKSNTLKALSYKQDPILRSASDEPPFASIRIPKQTLSLGPSSSKATLRALARFPEKGEKTRHCMYEIIRVPKEKRNPN